MKGRRNTTPTPKGGHIYNVSYGKKSCLYRTQRAALRRADWARQIGQEPRIHVLSIQREQWAPVAVTA